MRSPLNDRLSRALDRLRKENRFRDPRRLSSAPGAVTAIDGRSVVNFASNNYLNLAGHPAVTEAAARSAREWGAGATASRLMGGTLSLHRRLEEALAEHKGTEAALVFPSGYQANVGSLTALLSPEDTVVLDRLAHASLVDGARLSRARLKVFRHNDPEDLEKVLGRLGGAGERWVLVESVYSMDGDRAPLAELSAVCRRRGARLYVDEAHGTGVWGPRGRGVVNALGLEKEVEVCMGTLSKALGAQGGFVCGSRSLVDWLQNKARAYIYSTALAPAAAGAALAALAIARDDDAGRKKLFALSARLRAGLGLAGEGPIVPVVVGETSATLDLSAALWEAGYLAPAVRPPTVPEGTARVRFSLTAGHSEEQIDGALAVVRRWRGKNAAGVS